MMFLVTLAVMYFNTTIAKHLSWVAVIPLGGGEGYLLIRTKRVGTSDQGVVLSVFLNRVFLCTGSLKKTTCVMCDTKDIFFKEILFHDVSLKNYVIECFHSRGQHLR